MQSGRTSSKPEVHGNRPASRSSRRRPGRLFLEPRQLACDGAHLCRGTSKKVREMAAHETRVHVAANRARQLTAVLFVDIVDPVCSPRVYRLKRSSSAGTASDRAHLPDDCRERVGSLDDARRDRVLVGARWIHGGGGEARARAGRRLVYTMTAPEQVEFMRNAGRMTVDSMHDQVWTKRLIAGRANELDNLATLIQSRRWTAAMTSWRGCRLQRYGRNHHMPHVDLARRLRRRT